jgi:transposase
MGKTDMRHLPEDVRMQTRKQAIRLIFEKKKTQVEVAELLGVHKNSILLWVKEYRANGYEGLKGNARGLKPGEGRLLTPDQEKQVQKMIVDKMPDQLKLPFALWTRKAIQSLIIREFGIQVAVRTMGDYLKRWGFTPQKPTKRAYEQNPGAVNKWIKEEYPAIRERAKKEGAEIHWGDETGIRNDQHHARSYSPKGQTPVQKQMAKRISLNMISSITNQGKVRFMTYSDTMTSQLFIKFLKNLVKDTSGKIFMIVDNLRVHHSKKVKAWVEENKEQIELFYLPSYSPERNPDEYLNCDLKIGLSHKPAVKNKDQLKKHVNSHMRRLQRNGGKVKNYFRHKMINYAA